VNWPKPRSGLVIRYSYLWAREAKQGREEGTKNRPCAIIIVMLRDGNNPLVRVLPVTHSAPANPADVLEIPLLTKQRLGLDSERSWVVLTEANDFVWPGPDLRPAVNGDPASIEYGMLPPGFMKALRERLLRRWQELQTSAVKRTE
jgi:hypothetical protein